MFNIVRSEMTVLFLFLVLLSNATTFTKTTDGNYSSSSGWVPSYPGTSIQVGDEVIIDADVVLNVDIQDVFGKLTVNSGASLSGTKEIKEIRSGGVMDVYGSLSTRKFSKINGDLNIYGKVEATDEFKVDYGHVTVKQGGELSGLDLEFNQNGLLEVYGEVNVSHEIKMQDFSKILVQSTGDVHARKLKLADNSEADVSGNIYTDQNFELKDDARAQIQKGSDIRVINDLVIDDQTSLVSNGTILIEDDLKVKGNSVYISNGVSNVCDSDMNEPENKVEVEDDALFEGGGSVCMCATNLNNVIIDNSSEPISLPIDPNCGGPLPIELIKFEAERTRLDIVVRWSTASEIDNQIFELQVSPDGESFRTIETVSGAGNSNEQHNYQVFYIPQNLQKAYYFRLLNIDGQGRAEYSNIIQLGESLIQNVVELDLLSNMVHSGESLQLETEMPSNSVVQLWDMSGRVIPLTVSEKSIPIPAGLSEGTYVLTIEALGKASFTKVLIY